MKNDELTTTNEKPKGVQFPEDLSLRDYFAAKAMQGIIASETQGEGLMLPRQGGEQNPSYYLRNAQLAYEIADAMLRARNGGAS